MNSALVRVFVIGLAVLTSAALGSGQIMKPEVKAKVQAKVKELRSWSTDPKIVQAVKEHNAAPKNSMTNAKWKDLSLLDPFVRSFSKNVLADYLRSKKDSTMVEVFVSGADGSKIAFLSKTTSWNHAGKAKHEVPMAGKIYIGPLEVDESTGDLQVQVGLPVLDAGKPIGSLVIGLAASKVK